MGKGLVSFLPRPLSLGFWLGLVLFAGGLLVPATPDFPPVQRNALALALLMGAWWMTEALPLGVTALLPLALYPFLGIMTTKEVSPRYADHLVFLFMGGFLVALAMQEWNLHKRIALHTIALMGAGPRKLLFGFMAATAFLSMWISNTATTIMILPIGLGVIRKIQGEGEGKEPGDFHYGTILMLGIAYSASIGGIATLVGTPPNLVFSGVFARFFPHLPEVTFARWFLLVAPLTAVFFAALFLFLAFGLLRRRDLPSLPGKEYLAKELESLGPLSGPEKRVLFVFVLTALLWIFRADIRAGSFVIPGWAGLLGLQGKVQDSTVAVAMGILLFLLPAGRGRGDRPILRLRALLDLPWDILLLFGGGFALAEGIQKTGLAATIGRQLTFLGHLHPFFLLLVVALVLAFLTEFTSNTAVATTMLPILAGLSRDLHLDPMILMVPATVAASCAFLLPVATPPNAIVFGTRYIPIGKMVRVGLVLEFLFALLAAAYFTAVLF